MEILPGQTSRVEKQNPEEEIDALLGRLPEKIADRWDEEHADFDPGKRLELLREFFEHRQRVLAGNVDGEREPKHVGVVETRPLAVAQLIERIERGEHEEVGVGKAARVIASVRYPNTCYKVMFPLDRVPLGTNDISVEADIQDEIAAMGEHEGVRVPSIFSFVHEKDMRAITMERFYADSFKDVLEGKASLPEVFDFDIFFNALQRFIERLNERGYYHCDLHMGNIMVDRETGMPRVVDFGFSTRSENPEGVHRRQVVRSGQMIDIVLPLDLESVQLARQTMQQFLANKKGGV